VDRRDDGEAERRRKLELTGVWFGRFGAQERDWAGWGAPVGRGGALGALDRGWEAAWVAVDGGQGLQQRSGEELRSGRGNAVE
jgi:hypothetical protein